MRLFALVLGAAIVVAAIVACSSSSDPAAEQETGAEGGPIVPPGEGGIDAPVAPGNALQHGGKRIELRGVETGDGLFVQGAPYDRELGTTCYPGRTEDGTLHCVPVETYPVVTYADVNCTTGLAQKVKGSCTVATIAAQAVAATDPCDYKQTFWKLGAKLATPAKVYFKGATGCTEQTPAPDAELYALAAPLPPSAFVAFARKEVALTPALRAVVVDGDDGSRLQREEYIDIARGKVCSVNATTDGKTRCTPKSKFQSRGYSDGSCMTRTADPPYCVSFVETTDETTASTFELSSACSLPLVRSFPLGAKRASKDEYSKADDGGCGGPVASMSDVYDVGAEIAASTLPEIIVSTGGGPRVVERTYLSGGVVVSHLENLTDTTLGTRCRYSKAADGKLRCLPTGIQGGYYFTDGQCTVRLGNTQDPCEIGGVKYIIALEGPDCATSTHVYAPGAKVDPATTPLFIRQQDGNGLSQCTPVGLTGAKELYLLGPEVPAATFAEGTTSTR